MASYETQLLSGSTNGKQIKLLATSASSVLIHTAVAGTTNLDEVFIYCVNSGSTNVKLTVEWGENTAPDGNIEVNVPGESGYVLVVPGLPIQNGLEVRAFASVANILLINGYVIRRTA